MRKKRTIMPIVITSLLMASCSNNNPYRQNEFFPEDLLKEQLADELPNPGGELLYCKENGFAAPRVYVDNGISAEDYAQQVLDYLKGQEFKFVYTVDSTYVHVGIVPGKEDSYLVKEFSSLNECYFDNSWIFVYGNDEKIHTNDEGTIFLENEHVVRICNESGTMTEDKYKIDFDYDYEIIINTNPTNVTNIGH